MRYTREQLHEMSDFEVNEILATISCKELVCYAVEPHDDKGSLGTTVCVDGEYVDRVINYCRNWNDIMPLATENKVGISFCFEKPKAMQLDDFLTLTKYVDDSPQRAIACCLILVLQGE